MKYLKHVVIITVMVFGGCTSSYDIYSAENNGAKCERGIPFYTFNARIKQTTIYTRKWITVSLVLKKNTDSENTNDLPAVQYFISPEKYDQNQIVKAYNEASKAGYENAFKTFENNVDTTISIKTLNKETKVDTFAPENLLQTMVSNSIAIEKYVDYSKKYFYNSKIPFLGSSTSGIELFADGTLSKANSSQDNTKVVDLATSLISTAAGLFPVKELLLNRWNLKSNEIAANTVVIDKKATPPVSFQLFMKVFVDGYNYELVKYHNNLDTNFNKLPPLSFDSTKIITVTRFADKLESEKEETKSKIKFDGNIELPED